MTGLTPGDHHTPDSSCRSESKKIPHASPSGSPADVPEPDVTPDTPESTGATIARESETVQLLQPEGNTPIQPPISKPTGSGDTDRPSSLVASALRYDIFHADAPKPTVRSPTPIHIRARMESTLQLVFCARLLLEDHHLSTSQNRPTEVCILDDTGRQWLDAIQDDLSAQARIRWLVSNLVAEFLKDPSPRPEAIFEVVILGPVLCEVDYRALLSWFIERFDKSALLNDILQGMIQLLQSAPSGFLTDGDLVRIVSSLRTRLESTHAPDRARVYQLVFAISKVLEVMVRGEVKGLNRQRYHLSLLVALRNLKGVDDDEFLKFQVIYAYQMLLYLPDDETSFHAFLRYAESATVGVSAVGSVSKLDPMSALAAVDHIQQVAGNAIDVVKFSVDGARAFQATAEGAALGAEMAYWSQKKQPWFLALQAGYMLVQDGRLVDFNALVCDATCHYDVNFQRGVCQILGEVALNPLWGYGSRRSAIDFLRELFKADAGRRKDVKVRKWVATILQQISNSKSPEVSSHARTLLDDLQMEHTFDIKECRALHTLLPIPKVFPLLERALDITDIDHELACIRFRSLEERLHPVSIPLRAKATFPAPKDESPPLMARVQKFLRSDNLVFLLLGDSGSGKSTFCRQLERELWNQHQHSDGGRIPLYINLPSIDDPHCSLIEKYLQQRHDILEPVIREIKHGRQFVLICDGYDEPRLIHNLHASNRLNQPGQWKVKMIITCRSTFLGPKYQCRFNPLGDDKYHDKTSGLFEEATIVPFQESDIKEFVRQHVLNFAAQVPSDNPSAPSFDDYWEKLSVIPNLMNLVSNPFLLTLALEALPSRSIEALDSKGLEAMQQDLYDGFIQEWASLHEKRLHGAILKQDIRAAFISLLDAGFDWCLIDYIKRLADAIYEHQDGNPVVKFSWRNKEKWMVEFFGPEIETTLLREASPLIRAGIEYQFIHKSLLDYIYSRTFYDPDDSDDDDSDSEDGDDDPRGGGDDFHGDGGDSWGDGGNGLVGDNGDLAGENEGSTGGNAGSTGNNGGSSGGNGGSSGGNGGNQNSSGGGGNSSAGSGRNSSGGNNDGSRGDKNGSNGNEDDSHRRRDDTRSKRRRNATKSRPSTSSDPFSKRNLFKEPSVLQFLVERAISDSRLRKRLFSAIEKSKASSAPSMAAANAITILFKSGNLFQDAVLDDVSIPSDYMSTATGSTEPSQLPESNLTGEDLMRVLKMPNIPASASTVPATALAIPVSAPTVPAPMTFSTTIAQKTPAASVYRSMLEYVFSLAEFYPNRYNNQDKFAPQSDIGSTDRLLLDTEGSLFKCNLLTEPLVIQLLCERVKQHPDFEKQLLAVIDQSKTEASVATAAANAITILVRAGVFFNSADLRCIRIPGADLSEGQFDCAQFQGADLRGVNFARSWLRQVDFGDAQMKGVRFGELPYLKERSPVNAVAFSPNGKMFAVCLDDGGLNTYDTTTWTRVHQHKELSPVLTIAFSPNNQHLALGSMNGTCRLWDTANGETLLVMVRHTDWVRSVAFSPYGKQIASASDDRTIRLWDLETGECLFVLNGHEDIVLSVAYSADGRRLVSGSLDLTIRVWDPETGTPEAGWVIPRVKSSHVALSANGRQFALITGSKDSEIRLVDAITGEQGLILKNDTEWLQDIAFSPIGELIVSSSKDKTVRLWDSSSGQLISMFSGHGHWITTCTFSPGGRLIASGDMEGIIQFWEVNTYLSRSNTQELAAKVRTVVYSPDGLFIISHSGDNIIQCWNSSTGVSRSIPSSSTPDVYSVALSANCPWFAIGCKNGNIRLVNVGADAIERVLLGSSDHPVLDMSFSRCGRWLASRNGVGSVRLWDLDDAYDQERADRHCPGDCVAFSPVEDQLAVGLPSSSKVSSRLCLFDPRVTDLCQPLKEVSLSGRLNSMDYSPDGQRLVLSAGSSSVMLWDLQSDKLDVNLEGHTDVVLSVAYSSCGKWILSGSRDKTVRIWSGGVDSWSCVAVVSGCSEAVTSVSWNPVVPLEFVTGSDDGSVRVWRISGAEEGDVSVRMHWGSHIGRLCAANLTFKGAVGLSSIYRKLLIQRGAVVGEERAHRRKKQ